MQIRPFVLCCLLRKPIVRCKKFDQPELLYFSQSHTAPLGIFNPSDWNRETGGEMDRDSSVINYISCRERQSRVPYGLANCCSIVLVCIKEREKRKKVIKKMAKKEGKAGWRDNPNCQQYVMLLFYSVASWQAIAAPLCETISLSLLFSFSPP